MLARVDALSDGKCLQATAVLGSVSNLHLPGSLGIILNVTVNYFKLCLDIIIHIISYNIILYHIIYIYIYIYISYYT